MWVYSPAFLLVVCESVKRWWWWWWLLPIYNGTDFHKCHFLFSFHFSTSLSFRFSSAVYMNGLHATKYTHNWISRAHIIHYFSHSHNLSVCIKYVSLFRKTNLEFIFPFQDPVWMGSTRAMHCVLWNDVQNLFCCCEIIQRLCFAW